MKCGDMTNLGFLQVRSLSFFFAVVKLLDHKLLSKFIALLVAVSLIMKS